MNQNNILEDEGGRSHVHDRYHLRVGTQRITREELCIQSIVNYAAGDVYSELS